MNKLLQRRGKGAPKGKSAAQVNGAAKVNGYQNAPKLSLDLTLNGEASKLKAKGASNPSSPAKKAKKNKKGKAEP